MSGLSNKDRERLYVAGTAASLPVSYGALQGLNTSTNSGGNWPVMFGNRAASRRYEATKPGPPQKYKKHGKHFFTYQTPGNKGRTVVLRRPGGKSLRATKGALGRAGLGLGALGLGVGLSARLARTNTERRRDARQYSANRMVNTAARLRNQTSIGESQAARAARNKQLEAERVRQDKERIAAAARQYEAKRR